MEIRKQHLEKLVTDARGIWRAGLDAVRPHEVIARFNIEGVPSRPLADYGRVVVVGAGKASMAMAGAVERQLGARLDSGVVVVPHGYVDAYPPDYPVPSRLRVLQAGHPLPDASSVSAAEAAAAEVDGLSENDLVIALISGGGSALWTWPVEGVDLEEFRLLTHKLLLSGAPIEATNGVRRRLSRLAGGGLSRLAAPAEVVSLIISDAPGDESVVASGPTVERFYSPGGLSVLQRYGLRENVSESARRALTATHGVDRVNARVTNRIVADNAMAVTAAAAAAAEAGYIAVPMHTGRDVEQIKARMEVLGARLPDEADLGRLLEALPMHLLGEARDCGRAIAAATLRAPAMDTGICFILGGETTVAVRGSGRGGRNQELALAAALEIDRSQRNIVLLAAGTDGIDGVSPNAGAWVTPETILRARADGLDPDQALARNDSAAFFEALGTALVTGPTHTNVMDLAIVLVGPQG